VRIFISKMPISSPNPMFDHFLRLVSSSGQTGFGEKNKTGRVD